jgi:hypothetical protein
MKSENYDKELVETWKGGADGIMIFVRDTPHLSKSTACLLDRSFFSSSVASFIIEISKSPQRDPGDATAQVLSQMTGQLAAISIGPVVSTPSPFPPFRPSPGSIRLDAPRFLSLCPSLTYALVATLMQQSLLLKRACMLFYLTASQKFHMSHALELVPLLLLITVFLSSSSG